MGTKAAAQSVSGSMAPALPLTSMPSVPSISMPPAKAIEDMVCKVAEQKWIEDKATGAICSAITKELPIPNCQGTLEKMWDKIVTMCPVDLRLRQELWQYLSVTVAMPPLTQWSKMWFQRLSQQAPQQPSQVQAASRKTSQVAPTT